ncbi:MAG: hypothetical protein ACRCYC_08115 [Paraclostridium sp.]|uniref:ornithine cyclodeaminase family domain n=1 Tax=Paraclostridium sp. TaxID=2023273 RepID=UPI00304F45D4
MTFKLREYKSPDFTQERFVKAPDATYGVVEKDGVAPDNYHAMSIYPEYFKVKGEWVLAEETRMDCVPVITDENKIDVVEFRRLKVGDKVVVGRTEDAVDGIYLYPNGFQSEEEAKGDVFAFRSGRSRETSYTKDYENMYELLKYEKDHGYIVWVLGPAAVFSKGARDAMASLIDNGYVDAFLGGNAVATHDLEAGVFETALGQHVYTQESIKDGHYHHLDLLNKARKAGSIEKLIENENIKDGIIHACVKNNVPIVLGGSIRDDGPLPIVYGDVYEAQDAMRNHVKKATTVICLATQLHTIAVGNMTPSYRLVDGKIRPVNFYTIDISEFAVNKLRDRGSLEVITMVTNVQDFLGKLAENLVD